MGKRKNVKKRRRVLVTFIVCFFIISLLLITSLLGRLLACTRRSKADPYAKKLRALDGSALATSSTSPLDGIKVELCVSQLSPEVFLSRYAVRTTPERFSGIEILAIVNLNSFGETGWSGAARHRTTLEESEGFNPRQ